MPSFSIPVKGGIVVNGRSGLAVAWWHSWIGRCAIHLPWLLCALAYWGFLTSGQGLTALEFPVESPIAALGLVGFLTGICCTVTGRLSDIHREAAYTPQLITLACVRRVWRCKTWSAANEGKGSNPPRLGAVLSYVVLWGLFCAGGGSVASASGADLAPWTIAIFAAGVVVGAFLVYGGFLVISLAGDESWVQHFFVAWPTALALALYVTGLYLVSNKFDVLVAFGSHALVASGLLMMAILVLGVMFLLLTRATLRSGMLVVAALVVLTLVQEPLVERANPLLVTEPEVERLYGECATKVDAKTPGSDAFATSVTPPSGDSLSMLVSAEGGGIRAAYWTALSLEELSQARSRPLISDTAILSGVSGGSLGIATFLAAQGLPRAARLVCIREFLSGDFLSPLIAGLLFLDVPRLFIPVWLLDKHRGDYFESWMARRWLALTRQNYFYRSLRQPEAGSESSLRVYVNATDALSGEYIALTNFATGPDLVDAKAHARLSTLNLAVLDRLVGLRVAQAVHMSARFPYLSPNPDLRMPESEASHLLFGRDVLPAKSFHEASIASLVDGGYFDNSGLWPTLRLLEDDALAQRHGKYFVIHIVNEQVRDCKREPSNTGCIKGESELMKARLDAGAGWLLRPMHAVEAVMSQHSAQALTALDLARQQLNMKPPVLWNLPMPQLQDAPGLAGILLDVAQWLPIHGRDTRYGGVALGWTLAPAEREFLCLRVGDIRMSSVPGMREETGHRINRSLECSEKPSPPRL